MDPDTCLFSVRRVIHLSCFKIVAWGLKHRNLSRFKEKARSVASHVVGSRNLVAKYMLSHIRACGPRVSCRSLRIEGSRAI